MCGSKLDACVYAVEGFCEGALGGFYGVGFEEVGYFFALFGGAEGRCGGDYADAGVSGELGLDLFPVAADVVPCLLLGFALLEEAGDDDPGVLVADLAGDGVVEGAVDEDGRVEAGEQVHAVGLEAGVAAVFAEREGLLVEVGVAGGSGYGYGDVGEGGVEGLVGFGVEGEDAVAYLRSLGEDGGIFCFAEGVEEGDSKLLAVEGFVLLRWAEGGVDGAELAAEDGV